MPMSFRVIRPSLWIALKRFLNLQMWRATFRPTGSRPPSTSIVRPRCGLV